MLITHKVEILTEPGTKESREWCSSVPAVPAMERMLYRGAMYKTICSWSRVLIRMIGASHEYKVYCAIQLHLIRMKSTMRKPTRSDRDTGSRSGSICYPVRSRGIWEGCCFDKMTSCRPLSIIAATVATCGVTFRKPTHLVRLCRNILMSFPAMHSIYYRLRAEKQL